MVNLGAVVCDVEQNYDDPNCVGIIPIAYPVNLRGRYKRFGSGL